MAGVGALVDRPGRRLLAACHRAGTETQTRHAGVTTASRTRHRPHDRRGPERLLALQPTPAHPPSPRVSPGPLSATADITGHSYLARHFHQANNRGLTGVRTRATLRSAGQTPSSLLVAPELLAAAQGLILCHCSDLHRGDGSATPPRSVAPSGQPHSVGWFHRLPLGGQTHVR